MPHVTEAELLEEVARLSHKNDGGMTSEEWRDKLGRSKQYVLDLFRKAQKAGWLVRGKSMRTAINGRVFAADVYRIVRPKK